MKKSTAFLAGVLGAAVMSVITWAARNYAEMPVNMELMLGTMLGGPPDEAHWFTGLLVHLINGGIFGLVYGWLFEHVTNHAGWLMGLFFGLVHTIAAGIFLGLVPPMHALIPEVMAAPGFFMANLGAAGVIALFGLHMIFGAIVGAGYGRVLHPRESPRLTERPAQ